MNQAQPHPRRSAVIVLGRGAVLLFSVVAFVAGMLIARRHDRGPRQVQQRYVCPMHPKIVSDRPGDCPVCNMALEKARDASAPPTPHARATIADEVRRQVVAQVVRAPAWLDGDGTVTALLYKDSWANLGPGERAVFFRGKEPASPIPIRLLPEPATPWDTASVAARFEAQRPPATPRTGEPDHGWVQLAARAQEAILLPVSAVLYSGDGPYVLAAAAGEHSFTRRPVELGRILDSGYLAELVTDRLGAVAVLSGLSEGDRVVTADTFFLDAQRRLQVAQGGPEDVE